MGEKILFHNSLLCSGCLSCETTCAQRNQGRSGLSNARLSLLADPFTGEYQLAYCRQCEAASCAEACPTQAIFRHEDGYWDIDYETCIGCNLCVDSCEFGAMRSDVSDGRVLKCHMCQGEPACVAACGTGALVWMERPGAVGPGDRSQTRPR